MKDILTLGIESSCDETSASVVKNGREVLSNVINSQIKIHEQFGGVVPEIASRNHIEAISNVVKEAINQEELSQYIIDNRISNIIVKSLIPELIIAEPSIKTTELLIAFKILILYLSENILKTLADSMAPLQFQDITIKAKIKQIIDSNTKEKNKQNSDLKISFY